MEISMKITKYFLLFLLVVTLTLTLSSCGKKDKKNPQIEEKPTEVKMTDERFVEYMVEYIKLEQETMVRAEEIQNDLKLAEKYNDKVKKLEKKYPNAAMYPTTLTQEQQQKLGEKVDEALSKLESE